MACGPLVGGCADRTVVAWMGGTRFLLAAGSPADRAEQGGGADLDGEVAGRPGAGAVAECGRDLAQEFTQRGTAASVAHRQPVDLFRERPALTRRVVAEEPADAQVDTEGTVPQPLRCGPISEPTDRS